MPLMQDIPPRSRLWHDEKRSISLILFFVLIQFLRKFSISRGYYFIFAYVCLLTFSLFHDLSYYIKILFMFQVQYYVLDSFDRFLYIVFMILLVDFSQCTSNFKFCNLFILLTDLYLFYLSTLNKFIHSFIHSVCLSVSLSRKSKLSIFSKSAPTIFFHSSFHE